MRKIIIALIFAAVSIAAGLSQAALPQAAPEAATDMERLQIANSSFDYPVTPSDIYVLTYRQSTGDIVTRTIQVSVDGMVDLGIFGKIDASKMTFADLKKRVETLYAESYSRSYPSLSIQSVGVFQVSVGGEISRARTIAAWGMTRLSDVVNMAQAPNASLRNVYLRNRSSDSSTRYDVLKAMRLGDAPQDPKVRPGDMITLTPAGRVIRLNGEVRETGLYELLPEEGLRELIEKYGGGLTPMAEPNRVRVDKLQRSSPISEYVSLPKAYTDSPSLQDVISVTVSSKIENLPVVWFEGAIITPAGSTPQGQDSALTAAAARGEGLSEAPAEAASRVSVRIHEGEMLSDALREVRSSLSPNADLANASLYRQGSATSISVNLQPLLSLSNPASDVPLKAYDRVLIPFLRVTVTVSGAVISGGTFHYQANSTADYYIGLAGGADPARNTDRACSITDYLGKPRPSTDAVMPGDRIFVFANAPGITVSGAVTNPGAYPYYEGVPASTYINQAGGVDPERSTGYFYVTDLKGKRHKSSAPLVPGDRIFVPANRLGYNAIRYLPVITGILTLATSSITLMQILSN